MRGPQVLGVLLLVLFLRSCVFVADEPLPPAYGGRSAPTPPAVVNQDLVGALPGAPVAAAVASSPSEEAFTESGTELRVRQVRRAFERWLDAWRSRDVAAYLGSYGPAYGADGLDARSWARMRRERLGAVESIEIEIEVEDVSFDLIDDDRARVSYLQRYRDARFADSSSKVVIFERIGLGWRIVQERDQSPLP